MQKNELIKNFDHHMKTLIDNRNYAKLQVKRLKKEIEEADMKIKAYKSLIELCSNGPDDEIVTYESVED